MVFGLGSVGKFLYQAAKGGDVLGRDCPVLCGAGFLDLWCNDVVGLYWLYWLGLPYLWCGDPLRLCLLQFVSPGGLWALGGVLYLPCVCVGGVVLLFRASLVSVVW